jgi:hypothetical protein
MSTQSTAHPNDDLVLADGMRSAAIWDAMPARARIDWLAKLYARGPIYVRAQASVIAATRGQRVAKVINDWRYHGLIADQQADAALAAEVRQ